MSYSKLGCYSINPKQKTKKKTSNCTYMALVPQKKKKEKEKVEPNGLAPKMT